MKANELRIGNWVEVYSDDGRYCLLHEVDLIKEDGIGIGYDFDAKYSWEEITPIPLTEEILLKAGFHKEHEFQDFYIFSESNWCFTNTGDNLFYIRDNTDLADEFGICKKIDYVHQLQNLYFALTGEELNIEL